MIFIITQRKPHETRKNGCERQCRVSTVFKGCVPRARSQGSRRECGHRFKSQRRSEEFGTIVRGSVHPRAELHRRAQNHRSVSGKQLPWQPPYRLQCCFYRHVLFRICTQVISYQTCYVNINCTERLKQVGATRWNVVNIISHFVAEHNLKVSIPTTRRPTAIHVGRNHET